MGKEGDSSLNRRVERGGKVLETRGKVSKTFPRPDVVWSSSKVPLNTIPTTSMMAFVR
jgi:hypothetical protein